jgi:xanthine dehydrogenase accessory factor
MVEIASQIDRWLAEGKRVALATVIATERSAPRPPGAVMAVTEGYDLVGSVSGGCVEAAVAQEAVDVLLTGRPRRLAYGISDEDAAAVGLSCGGIVHIFVESLAAWPPGLFRALREAAERQEPVALVTAVSGPASGAKMLVSDATHEGTLGLPPLESRIVEDARTLLARGETGVRRYTPTGGAEEEVVEVFLQSFVPPPRLYVFGATDHAGALVRIGKLLGYHVTVCDARAAFAVPQRFPEADDVVVRWPHEFLAEAPVDVRTAICVFTHDAKFEVPLLKVALEGPAGYIGVLGSRRTHEARCRALVAEGVPPGRLARLRAPIGLDIGARTPAEIAVAIAAEMIALRSGRLGRDVVAALSRGP